MSWVPKIECFVFCYLLKYMICVVFLVTLNAVEGTIDNFSTALDVTIPVQIIKICGLAEPII